MMKRSTLLILAAGVFCGVLWGLLRLRSDLPQPDPESSVAGPSSARPGSSPDAAHGDERAGSASTTRLVEPEASGSTPTKDGGDFQAAADAVDPSESVPAQNQSSDKPRRPTTLTLASHVAYLRALGEREVKIIQRPDGDQERLALVQDDAGPHPLLVIRERFRPDQKKPARTSIQVADQILVRFAVDPAKAELDSFLADHQLGLGQALLLERSYLLTVPEVTLDRLVALEAALATDPRLEGAEPNALVYASAVPNDPSFAQLWGLQNIAQRPAYKKGFDLKAATAWNDLNDCSATMVAVLDTGIDSDHPDLKANIRADLGRSFVQGSAPTDFMDRQGHGTHVAGTIGAIGNNQLGVTGVCWKAAIIPVKVLGDDGVGTSAAVSEGIVYATRSPAKILNMSLGGDGETPLEQRAAIDGLAQAGKLVVVAAGNENRNIDVELSSPASYDSEAIISVAAVTGAARIAAFSNYGETNVDIAAPGQDILSTIPRSQAGVDPTKAYGIKSGTSMATPHVAGAVALFWSYAPELTAKQVREMVFATASTHAFNKPINGKRMLDLQALMNSAKPQVALRELQDGRDLTVSGGRASVSLVPPKSLAKVTTVELLSEQQVLAKVDGSATEIKLAITQLQDSLPLRIRATDEKGRTYLSEVTKVKLVSEKIPDFSQLKIEGMGNGPIACKLLRVEGNQERVLHEVKLAKEEICQTVCALAGPLTYSSNADIRCGSAMATYYEKAPPP